MKGNRWMLLLLAVGALALAALAAPEPTDEREQLLAADRAFDQATAEKGIEGWVSFFAPNGSMLPGDEPPVTGPDAIRQFMGPTLAQPGVSLRWQPTRTEVLIPGVLGMTTGRWERRSVDAEGKPQRRKGTYVTVWKKQPDGAWKVVFDTGNPDPPESEESPTPAPPLGVDHWIQPKDGGAKNWQELRGKVVVLEFWATWCAPCVAVMPHLNELAKKFENRGVQFISITDEDASTIEGFLREKPIAGWVALDTDRSMFNRYGVEGVPHTVLVGPDGVLLAATNPEAITESVLEEILAGKVVEARAKLPKPLAPTDWFAGLRSPDAPPRLYEVLIRPRQGGDFTGIKWSQSEYIARGFSIMDAIQHAYDVSSTRAVIPEALARDKYDILVTIPKADMESLRRVLQQALEVTFGLRVRREMRETDVFVLLAPEGRTPALREAAAGSRRGALWDEGKIEIRGLSLRNLAQSLESSLERPVLEETGIEGAFDIELTWDPKKAESLFEALRKLGLELREARRPVELLIVELLEPPAQPEAAKPN